jgi:hypothetical protein
MNEERVKELLCRLHECKKDFRVLFSGKKSGKVNGLYRPEGREIIIHDRNFTVDGTLLYTAVHELTHHIMDTEYGFRGTRSHTRQFWALFHDLLGKARREGIYTACPDRETQAALEEARRVSREIAELQRRLGRLLIEVEEGCERLGLRAEDCIENGAQISRKTWRAAVKAAYLDLPAELGADVQAAVIQERDGGARQAMRAAAEAGKSVAQVKQAAQGPPEKADEAETLEAEKRRLETAVKSLTRRLLELERRLAELRAGGEMSAREASDAGGQGRGVNGERGSKREGA